MTPALELLNRVFGYPAFRGPQQAIIEHVASGGDSLVLMPTGGGKSLCFQIPAMLRAGCGIVVSPLIALMRDQVAALNQAGVKAAFLNSSLDGASAARIERQLLAGDLDLLYIAPERLLGERTRSLLARARKSACSPLTKPTASRNGATISVRNMASLVSSPPTFPPCRASLSPPRRTS